MYTKKIIWVIKLIGLTKDGKVANTHQAKEVACFADPSKTCKITFLCKDLLLMETRNKQVFFERHHKNNYYKAEALNGKELRIALKKTTGNLKCLKDVPMPDNVVERLLAKGYYHGRD
jgi:hypothetical protein